jgi:hypothetical protein
MALLSVVLLSMRALRVYASVYLLTAFFWILRVDVLVFLSIEFTEQTGFVQPGNPLSITRGCGREWI